MTLAAFPPLRRIAPRMLAAHWSVRSFRSQVAMAFAVLAVLLAAALSSGLAAMFGAKLRNDEIADLRNIAGNAARVLADGLVSRSREIESLAQLPSLWTDGLGAERVRLMLDRIRSVTPYSAWVGVAAADGTVLAAVDGLLVGQSVAERPWFRSGLENHFLGDLHQAKLLAALLPPGRDGAPHRFLDFASPIRREGRIVGVLGMHASWDWARVTIESLLPPDAVDRRLEVFVFDRQGHAIYATAGGDLARYRRETMEGVADGEHYLSAQARVSAAALPDDLGWTILTREPESTALAPAHRIFWRAMAMGAVLAVLASFCGWCISARMTRPLKRLSDAARDLEAGRPGAAIPVLDHNPEITQLSLAMSAMTARLQGHAQQLETRVRERTAALEQANRELDRQSRTDALTGLLNRRGLDDQFTQFVASARRRRSALSVLMIDIDHFKRINDRHGHESGDAALRALAASLKRRLRETDVVARFGGEEFTVLLPDTDGVQARIVAEALVAMVRDEPIEPVGRITISCGIAQVRLQGDTAQSAMARADEALYRAKSQGRDRALTEHDAEVEAG